MATTFKAKENFWESNSTNSTDTPKTRIIRSTSSIYKRLGLNFKPLRRRQIEEILTVVVNTNESSTESSHESKSSSEAVLHDPVYSKIASSSPTRIREAQAVIPLCAGLKTLISTSNDEKESCRIDNDDIGDKTSVKEISIVKETEKISVVAAQDDRQWSTNERRTSWIDDSTSSFDIRFDQRSISSHTVSPTSLLDNGSGGGVNFRRFSLSPSDAGIFLRDSPTEIEHSSDSSASMRDSGIVLHDDIGGKPVFAQRNSASSSDVVVGGNCRSQMNSDNNITAGRRFGGLSPYDGRTSLNKNQNHCHKAIVAKVVQYDSDTLRKTAEKNRETAAKLLPKLQKKRNSISKDAAVSGKRRETQTTNSSSSKGSSSQRASSVFTDSSGGSSAGSYDVLSFHDIITEYHDQQRKQLTWRSISNDNFANHFDSAASPQSSSDDSSPYRHSSSANHVNDRQGSDEPRLRNRDSFCKQDNHQQNERESTTLIRLGIFSENEIPVYAVPQKFFGTNNQQSSSTNRSSDIVKKISKENMKNSPPPLPRKPPPSLDDNDDEFDDQRRRESSSISSETESLEDMNPIVPATLNEASAKRRTSFDDVTKIRQNLFSLNQQQDDLNNNHRTSFIGGDFSSSLSINISKRPIVPVHPYKEKIFTTSKNNNAGIGINDDSMAHSPYLAQINENFSTPPSSPTSIANNVSSSPNVASYRPPVPPKPDRSTTRIPPQLPPKPSNFTLKRPEMNSNNNGSPNNESSSCSSLSSSSKCRRDGPSPPNDETSTNNNNVCNSAPHRWCTVDERFNDDDVLWQETFDFDSPGRRSVDFVSIVYDRLASSCEKKRRLYRLDESRSFNGECCSDCGSDDSPSPDVVENEKKVLLSKLNAKLIVLKKAYREIEQEIRYNENVGRRLDVSIEKSDRLTTYDKQKYRLHVEDTEKLAHLFLKLSAQLARVENDLDRMPPTSSPKEKQHFTERRQRLLVQLTDAKNLKDDLDRRCENVTMMLREILNDEQIGDYENFIDMKSRLLVDAREIEENITLLDERRNTLEQSLTPIRN